MNPGRLLLARLLLGVALVAVLEVLAQNGTISTTIMSAPSLIAERFWTLVQTAQFHADLYRTTSEIVASAAVGITAGVVIGSFSAQWPLVGEVLEPYLISLYAMPTLIFYPLLLAVMGLGSAPIVTITSVMVAVPAALNTMVGIRSINPTLRRLGRSLNCSQPRINFSILLPAAAQLVFPGIKLGTIYAVIGCIAMEFILANGGLGYRIGYDYNNFAILDMWANILAVVMLSIVAVSVLTLIERRVRRDLS